MTRKQRNQKSLPTIWRVPGALWGVIEQVLAELDPSAHTGQKRIDERSALNGSSSAFVAAVSGIACPKSSPTMARSTARFSRVTGWYLTSPG